MQRIILLCVWLQLWYRFRPVVVNSSGYPLLPGQ